MKQGFHILWGYLKIGIIGILLFVGLIALLHLGESTTSPKKFVSQQISDDSLEFKPIDWRILREMDYSSGQASEKLRAIDGKKIQIPGFLVPLEDSQNQISEFLVVPSPQACIHVPPPPPNQMIYVKMLKPIQFNWGYRAYWIMGTLSLSSVQSPYGSVSFEMKGDSIKPFNYKNSDL